MNPKSENILKLIRTFEKVIEAYPSCILDMDNVMIDVCGTSHCHAGWYAVGKFLEGKTLRKKYYSTGIMIMNNDLGFPQHSEDELVGLVGTESVGLVKWAKDNPDLWGNIKGELMFSHLVAFTSKSKGQAKSLRDIVDHWRGVYERVKEREKQEMVRIEELHKEALEEWGDITKEIAISKSLQLELS